MYLLILPFGVLFYIYKEVVSINLRDHSYPKVLEWFPKKK